MSNAVFEFYVVHSNPRHPGEPRIFLVKKKNERISLALEIDELNDSFVMTELDIEEAELWGAVKSISDEFSVVLNVEGQDEVVQFSQTIIRGIETIVWHRHALGAVRNRRYPMRWIPSSKCRNSSDWLKTENTHMKRLQAGLDEPLGVCYGN